VARFVEAIGGHEKLDSINTISYLYELDQSQVDGAQKRKNIR
jgi:hypothetical protein